MLVVRLPARGTTLRSRVNAKPKVHVVDSGLAARLLRLTPGKLAGFDILLANNKLPSSNIGIASEPTQSKYRGDFTNATGIPGGYCTKLLADGGADVVEPLAEEAGQAVREPVLAALAQLGYALSPTSDGAGAVTVSEWVTVGMAGLAALGVYAVRNGAAPDGAHEA